MKHRTLLTLAVAGALLLTLPACSPKETETTPTPEALPTESMSIIAPTPGAQPTGSMNIVTPEPSGTPEAQPTESVNVIAPEETGNPAKPLESQVPDKGSELAPSPKPTPEPTAEPTPDPTPEAPSAGLTAADVYAKVSAVASGTAMMDSSFALDAFYPDLSEADFEDFVLYMPDASAKIEEILIGKVASGRMDAVKAACESRQQGMKEEAEFYATTGDYVDSYKLVINGDWIMFAVVANPAEAESAFHDCTK